ncbi:MAG: hypothetical protein IKJ99_03770 [Oscillospiraceae bacterium]|nr:hypothetical protein [Oscillospiraceae bacterium]
MTRKIVDAVEDAEKKLGTRIPEGVWLEVLKDSYRKLDQIHRPVEYLPVLFRNELADYYSRLDINLKGVANHVQRMLAIPMSSSVS